MTNIMNQPGAALRLSAAMAPFSPDHLIDNGILAGFKWFVGCGLVDESFALLRPPQKVVADLLLHCRDLREGLLQQFLLDVARLAGMDDVGGRPPGLDGRQLRAEPQLHQKVVRGADFIAAGRHDDAAFDQSLVGSLPRVGDPHIVKTAGVLLYQQRRNLLQYL